MTTMSETIFRTKGLTKVSVSQPVPRHFTMDYRYDPAPCAKTFARSHGSVDGTI